MKITLTPHLTSCLSDLKNFKPFQDWISKLSKILLHEKNIKLQEIQVTDVDYFGTRIGFVKANAHMTWEDGTRLPGIAFLRGGSVSILTMLTPSNDESPGSSIHENEKESYVILTQQPRIPIANMTCLELPAGMLDDSGDFIGVAAQELKEECGLLISKNDLIDMTRLAYGDSNEPHVYPSAGGCDEFVKLFLYQKRLPMQEIKDLQDKLCGLREHGERIRLKIVKKSELWKSTRDMKALASLALFDVLKNSNLL